MTEFTHRTAEFDQYAEDYDAALAASFSQNKILCTALDCRAHRLQQ